MQEVFVLAALFALSSFFHDWTKLFVPLMASQEEFLIQSDIICQTGEGAGQLAKGTFL